MSDHVIQLVHSAGEARVDSRVIAERLGVKHKNTIALTEKHSKHFLRFGLLPFQTEAVKVAGARGAKHHRFALLNEDQAYFLLSLTKNTARVVDLKANLVMAFRDARNQAGLDSVMGMILLTAPAPWEKRFGDDYYRALARTPALFLKVMPRERRPFSDK